MGIFLSFEALILLALVFPQHITEWMWREPDIFPQLWKQIQI